MADDDFFDTEHESAQIELTDNLIGVGDEVNLFEIDPALKNVMVGTGWDVNAFDADVTDVDVSVFLLNKNGMTRVDEDFVFYNNPTDGDDAVKHHGDSRTGAGDGDDEIISVNLSGIHFDVVQLVFVLSIYKGEEKDQNLGMVQGAFLRVVNKDTNLELARYVLEEDFKDRSETAMIVAALNREGPKWHFRPIGEFVNGGLGAVAEKYGCIIVNQ